MLRRGGSEEEGLSPRPVQHPRRSAHIHGQIAQLVEQGIENPRVGGSTPSLATTFLLIAAATGLAGCTDPCGAVSSALDTRCEKLCCDVADALQTCIDQGTASLTWSDVGAEDRRDFARQCADDWDRASADLTAYELQEATAVCRDSRESLDEAQCDTLRALYGSGWE